jgi:hypothetical protein
MNPFRRQSDGEVVEALRRTERWRRPVGLAFIVLGLVLLAFHVWGEAWMRRKALQIADALSELSETHRPLPADIRDASAATAYAVGFRSGLLLSQGVVIGAIFVITGVRLRFGGRKDRLLIQQFDLATNGQLSREG